MITGNVKKGEKMGRRMDFTIYIFVAIFSFFIFLFLFDFFAFYMGKKNEKQYTKYINGHINFFLFSPFLSFFFFPFFFPIILLLNFWDFIDLLFGFSFFFRIFFFQMLKTIKINYDLTDIILYIFFLYLYYLLRFILIS